jgi:hypothetical protein
MTHHHTMQFLDSLHNWNFIMDTFVLGQDVVLILLFMILLMPNNENIITVCLRELILYNNFSFSYFIKQLPNGFPVQDSIIHALGMWLRFRKAKRRWPAARDYFTLSETLATSHVHG